MNKTDAEYIIVGKIGSTYGVRGWFKVFPFTEEITNLLEYKPWYLEEGDTWRSIQIKEAREHGKCVIAKLPAYNTPEEARVLTGKKIAVKRSQLPTLEKGEYYWKDLEGLTVINQDGENLGKVTYLIETGANDVLVVENQGKEYAIPYLPNVVTRVDLANQAIHVNWELV